MRTIQRLAFTVTLAALAAGCASDPTGQHTSEFATCPTGPGNSPAAAHALLHGVAKSASGSALAGYSVRVVSCDPNQSFRWYSSFGPTDSNGSFDLTVFQLDLREEGRVLEEATVELQLYPTTSASEDSPVRATVTVLMHFAPLGDPVDATVTDVVFPFEP